MCYPIQLYFYAENKKSAKLKAETETTRKRLVSETP